MSQDNILKSEGAVAAVVATVVPSTTSNAQPVATTNTDGHNDAKKTAMNLDVQKAKEVLEHRKMLLERMQLCRKATQARLMLYEKGGSDTPTGDNTVGEMLTSSRKRKFASKEIELQTYADLSKYALSYTVKKAPPIKAPPPAPRNISLRTGSTVGNKMKAAVATLTTNVGWISDASSQSSVKGNQNKSVSPVPPAIGSSQAAQATMKNGSGSMSAAPLHKAIPPPNRIQSAAIPSAPITPASSTMPAPKNNVKKLSSTATSTGKHIKKKSSQSGKKRTGKHVRGGNNMSTSEMPATAKKPLHLAGSKGMGQNGREFSYPSRVLCPETERLRRKRRDLIAKLDNMTRKSYGDTLVKDDIDRKNSKRVKFNDNPYSNGKKMPWKSFMRASSAPCFLPEKRKTQWDYVLEEMRWLATDFVEENKWKKASAKTLSAAMMTHHLEAATQAKLSPPKQTRVSPSSSKLEENGSNENLVEIKSSKEDESMEEDSDSDSGTDELISSLEFVDPTDEDVKSAKMTAKLINNFVVAHWKLANTNSNMPAGDEQVAEYARYRKIRRNESKTSQIVGVEASREKSLDQNDEESSTSRVQHLSFEEIQKQIQNCLQRIKTTDSELGDRFDDFYSDISDGLEGTDLEIQEDQVETLQFTEALWKEEENLQTITGSIITGPIGCGKTFSTGLLLWRRRQKGPQLLLCAGASLIRWRHELRHFPGLNVLTFGASGWCYEDIPIDESFGSTPNDVILCDFSGARSLRSRGNKRLAPFATVIVDVRSSSFPSLISSAESNNCGKQPSKKTGAFQDSQFSYGQMVAEELYNSEWWNAIIENLLSQSTKCALVETSGAVKGHLYEEEQKVLPPTTKEKSDIISFKVAFLYHQLFQSKHKTFCRRAFWWAKKRYIAMKKTKTSGVDLSEGVKGVLLNMLKAISFFPEISIDEIEHDVSSSIPKWTVQTCPLSPSQRDSYERACLFVRGSFQFAGGNTSANSYLPSAKAFLRLRRACFYSDLHELLLPSKGSNLYTKSKRCLRLSTFCGSLQDVPSSSQPDISHAKSLLEKSSKLRQLLMILCKDCGFDVPSKSYLLDAKLTRRGRKSSVGKRKKVLILASLPEVLLLISSFLSAIGIAHECLAPQNCLQAFSYPDNEETLSTSTENISSWVNCQQSIGRFEISSLDSSLSTNVLVSSPNSLSSTSLGLNASNAEVIISLDEDWSGGSDLSTFSILRKNRTNNMQKVSGRKYIKLIAEDTCEHSFLTFDKKMRGKKSVQAMPMMISSLELLRLDQHGSLIPSSRSVIGKNMLRYVGVPLQNVLSSDFIPLGALHGGPTLFLASGIDEYRASKDESDLAKYGDKVPALLNDLDEEPNYVERVGGRENANFFAHSISKIERASAMPHETSLISSIDLSDPYEMNGFEITPASSISTRRDLFSFQIQKYLTSTKVQLSQIQNINSKNGNAPKKISKPNAEKSRRKEKGSSATSSEFPPAFSQVESTKSKPEEIASSLIWYDCDNVEENQSEEITNDEGVLQESKKRRENSYVRSYMSIKRNFDGNQGCESLVYFPPLFPGLIQANHCNENDYNAFEESLLDGDMNHIISEERKRKNPPAGNSTNSKRLRGNPHTTPVPEFSMGIQSITPSQALLSSSILGKDMANELMAVSDVDFMDSATDLFDGDFLPDLNITKDEEVINDVGLDAERSDEMELEDTTKPGLDEDFGILGSGLLPSLEDSSKAAMRQNGYSNLYSYWLDPFEPLSSNEDLSLNGPSLDSIIVHVKKSTKPATGMMHRPVSSMQPPSLTFNKSNIGMIQSNGGLTKKKKKNGTTDKRNSLGPTTAFVPNSSLEPMKLGRHPPSVHTSLLSKDPRARSERNASTIFDSLGHRGAPSIRVQHQLQALLDPSRNQMVRSGLMSPNYQNSLVSSQFSIRELLPDENTGDAAKVLAKKQLSSFCHDSLVSFGVDFGPFSVGILQEASAKNRKIPVETQIGIKLPMGVKVPKSMGSFSKHIDVWTSDEDKLLHMYVVRFGFNWHVISQALTRKSRISAFLDTVTIMNPIRSARLCEERWNMIKLDPANNIEETPVNENEITKKTDELQDSEPDLVDVIIDKRHLVEAEKMATRNPSPSGNIVNRLQKLKKASLKTQHVPLTIPGYTSNMPPLQIVPSHPSHSNSVQEAIATSAGPSGIVPPRAEMWPLQFLDLTEKQHQEVEKKKKSNSTSSQMTQQQVMPRNTHPNRQSAVPNPGVPHVATHTHRQGPTNAQMSGQRQAPPAMPHVQQQVTPAPAYAKQVMPGQRPNTNTGK